MKGEGRNGCDTGNETDRDRIMRSKPKAEKRKGEGRDLDEQEDRNDDTMKEK